MGERGCHEKANARFNIWGRCVSICLPVEWWLVTPELNVRFISKEGGTLKLRNFGYRMLQPLLANNVCITSTLVIICRTAQALFSHLPPSYPVQADHCSSLIHLQHSSSFIHQGGGWWSCLTSSTFTRWHHFNQLQIWWDLLSCEEMAQSLAS